MQTLKRIALSLSAAALCCLTAMSTASAGTFTAPNSSDSMMLEYKVYASQFLNMATFGASSSDIDALATRMSQIGINNARAEWIDVQFALPASEHYPLAKQMIGEYGLSETAKKSSAVRSQAWWHHAVAAPDQLRQRVAWALAQIWVTDGISGGNFLGATSYYDVLVRNSFGNYRSLMQDMTLNPVMGVYLSHFRNAKADPARNQFPDENFARELLQLFTIGPLELESNGDFKTDANGNTRPTYGNAEITAFARAFTGLDGATSTKFGQGILNPHLPMKMWDSAHDMNSKTLLQGQVLPPSQTGMKDISDALDNAFHHPNLGPFVARLLIQRLVMSNPSKSYVGRVANVLNGGSASPRGDMKAVIKAILLDTEATSGVVLTRTNETTFRAESGANQVSRLKEPVVRFAGLMRAFTPTSTCPKGRFILRQQGQFIGQGPYESPSVFNFYSPDFQPAGPLAAYNDSKLRNGIAVAPEFQIWTPLEVGRFSNRLTAIRQEKVTTTTLTGTSCAIVLDLTKEKQLAAKPADLVNHLDLLLCQGTMSDTSRDTIVQHITRESTNAALRARNAILATMLAPECAISP